MILENEANVALVFSPTLLDRADYHATAGWTYGRRITPLEAKKHHMLPSATPQEFPRSLKRSPDAWDGKNEVVFQNAVSLKHLRRIVVSQPRVEMTIRALKAEGVHPPRGVKWHEFVVGASKTVVDDRAVWSIPAELLADPKPH